MSIAIELPDGVTEQTVHGTPAVCVDLPSARAVIHRDGAQLTSWAPEGEKDVLWTSRHAHYAEGSAIRGGIPLIGPWFGPGRDGRTTPSHGWLRSHRWDLAAATGDGQVVELRFVLEGADPSGQGIGAEVRYRIGRSLDVALTVTAGDAPLELEAALHTYLAVGDVRRIAIEGLGGADYLDNTRGLAPDRQDTAELSLQEATDRVYEVSSPVRVRDDFLDRALISTPSGSSRTVVWNPWSDGAAGLDDMADDCWTDFACVEAAVAKDGFVPLGPGDSHTLAAHFEIEHPRH